jgi:hypothetical protein
MYRTILQLQLQLELLSEPLQIDVVIVHSANATAQPPPLSLALMSPQPRHVCKAQESDRLHINSPGTQQCQMWIHHQLQVTCTQGRSGIHAIYTTA